MTVRGRQLARIVSLERKQPKQEQSWLGTAPKTQQEVSGGISVPMLIWKMMPWEEVMFGLQKHHPAPVEPPCPQPHPAPLQPCCSMLSIPPTPSEGEFVVVIICFVFYGDGVFVCFCRFLSLFLI